MYDDIPAHLRIYHKEYFAGTGVRSGYTDYHTCRGVLTQWSRMVEQFFAPTSVLDVGAAYGFVVEHFDALGIPSVGVEPSEWARNQAARRLTIHAGALPDLSMLGDARFDVTTCTEVLEHVPEGLVPASLQAIAQHTDRLAVSLTMLEGPGADGDEGHICLKSREWWEAAWDATGLMPRPDLEMALDRHAYSRQMYWSGRFFVRERV
jgi:hypothetical protein